MLFISYWDKEKAFQLLYMKPIQWRHCPNTKRCYGLVITQDFIESASEWDDRIHPWINSRLSQDLIDALWTMQRALMFGSPMSSLVLWPQRYSELLFFPVLIKIPGPEEPFLKQIAPKPLGSHAQFKFQWSGIFQWKKKKSLIEKFLTSSNPINFTVVAHMLMRAVCVRLLLNLQNTIPRTCILYVVWHRHIWFIFRILKQYYEHFIRLQKWVL